MNEIVKNESVMKLPEIVKMAELFAQSGMFADAKAMGQAFVKIQAGQEIGIPPFAAMSGIHIIQGKPTIGAGLIASTVKGSGKYDYRVVENSDTICSIDFYQSSQKIGNSTFTIEDARKAGTKNIEKFPKNMLFARAISNGVKWFCPDVFAGPVYVPEEMEKTEDIQHEVIITHAPQPEKKPSLSDERFQKAMDILKTSKDVNSVLTSLDKFELTDIQLEEVNEIVFKIKNESNE